MAARPAPPLAAAIAHTKSDAGVKSEAGIAVRARLAAHVTPAGHWQLANAEGEVMTVAGVEEMGRAIMFLQRRSEAAAAQPGQDAATQPTFVLTDEAAVRGPSAVDDLPEPAQLTVLVDTKVYGLHRAPVITKAGQEQARRWLVEIRPHLLLDIPRPDGLRDTLWLFERKLDADKVRLLSLEPGAARTLPAVARREANSRRVLADSVDPAGLVQALPAMRGQKVLLVGRIDRDHLWYQPRSGAEQALALAEVRTAAAVNDIALVLLDSRLTRQPGERTWAYLKVSIPGLEQAMHGATLGDFYNALAAAQGTLVLRSSATASGRLRFDAMPLAAPWGQFLPRSSRSNDIDPSPVSSGERSIGGVLQEVVSGLTGNVVASSVQLYVPGRARQIEIERRWLPGLPSGLQMGYVLLLAIGAGAWPVAARWWRWVWPVEDEAEYSSGGAYWAARIVRGFAFVLLFVPVVAVAAFPVQVMRGLADTFRLILRSLRGRRPGARSSATPDMLP